MTTRHYDSIPELVLSGMCVDEAGRYVPRDDYETACEAREALREQRQRAHEMPRLLMALAVGLLVAVIALSA